MSINNYPTSTDIEAAHNRIKDYIHNTAILSSKLLNKTSGANLFFKCENFQKVGAFKYRGASNAILKLKERNNSIKAVATHSSGNHAQALALAARTHGLEAHIVMPKTAPIVKQNAVNGYGAKVYLCEPTLQAREDTLKDVVKQTNAYFVHPYNNYDIIEAQATAAKELIEKHSNLDYIIAPVGGGGLLSGTLLATHYFSSKTKVIAAEPIGADDAFRSFKAKKFFPSENPNTIADGLLTSLGDKTFPIIMDYLHDIYTVSDEEIIEAMKLIWERMKIIIEPSSAVVFAVVLKNRRIFENKKIGLILSGGNIDLTKIPF